MSNANIIEVRPDGPLQVIPLAENRSAHTRCLLTTAEQDGNVGQHSTVGLTIQEFATHAQDDTIVLQPGNAAAIALALLKSAADAKGINIMDMIEQVDNIYTFDNTEER